MTEHKQNWLIKLSLQDWGWNVICLELDLFYMLSWVCSHVPAIWYEDWEL